MQNYELTLSSDLPNSFRCLKAANSLDIDINKKSIHNFKVKADLDTYYNIGLIVGASGSGKTTLAKHIFGENIFNEILDLSKPVIDQFDKKYSYDECAEMLSGVGLTSVPCWIRPAYTLSNGQKARAECALQMANNNKNTIVIDEWTSVVDRTVAKVMSYCIQKHARKTNKQIILLACHHDIIEWLNPDWIIDCNKQLYEDRRELRQTFERTEKLEFEIKEVDISTWKYFSKYHYLSENIPTGHSYYYGLFHNNNQIGFQAFSNYVPYIDKTKAMQLHSNRTVIHPDYCGFGLGIKLINITSQMLFEKGYDIRAKTSSIPIVKSRKKYPFWKLLSIDRKTKNTKRWEMGRTTDSMRKDIKTYSFKFMGLDYKEDDFDLNIDFSKLIS